MNCPICDSNGSLHEVITMVQVRPLPSVSIDVPLLALQCSHCGEEIERSEDLAKNDTSIRRAKLKWLADNISSHRCAPTLIKEIRSLYGISQKELSSIIGATGNAISKYETGTINPSSMAMKLLTLIAIDPDAFSTLAEMRKNELSLAQPTSNFARASLYMYGSPIAFPSDAGADYFTPISQASVEIKSYDYLITASNRIATQAMTLAATLISGDYEAHAGGSLEPIAYAHTANDAEPQGMSDLYPQQLPALLPGFLNQIARAS